jgi:glutathione synthase/RimK-type ligase-like ATP-grasp enzyme
MALLLAGGREDPNLTVLAEAAKSTNVEVLDLRLSASESPAFCWNPEEGPPRFWDKQISATGAFIRHDVFSGMIDPRPEVSARASAWYQTLMGWLLSEPQVRIFNRHISQIAMNKPATLVFARQIGLRIPATQITNEAGRLNNHSPESLVAKPVLGGDYCYSFADAMAQTDLRSGLAAMPAIVQRRLSPPEVRIYVIGPSAFAFEVRSSSLDYRVNQDAELILLPDVPQELSLLRKLMSHVGLDFGAADFKTHPDTGELVFLELNTSPMFARFDQVSQGQLCAAMLHELATP